jgi:hypothetical protein
MPIDAHQSGDAFASLRPDRRPPRRLYVTVECNVLTVRLLRALMPAYERPPDDLRWAEEDQHDDRT